MLPKLSLDKFLPPRGFLIWWAASLMLFLGFDLLWCIDIDSFKPFTDYSSLYVFTLIAAGVVTLPAVWSLRWIEFTLLELIACLLTANLMYATTYYVPIPLESYLLAGNLTTIGPSVAEAFKVRYLILPLIPAIAMIFTRRQALHSAKSGLWRWTWLAAGILCCAAGWLMIAGRGGFRARMELMNRNGLAAPVYTVFASLTYDLITATDPLTPDARKEIDLWLKNHRELSRQLTAATAAAPHGKVAFILVESLESWPIGAVSGGHEITPNLNRLIADTANVIYFPNVLTQTKDGRSIDAQLLYLAGRLPLKTGVYSMKYPQLDYPSLPKAMRDHCHSASVLFSPDPPGMWNQEPIARAFGFERIFSADTWQSASPTDHAPDGYIYDKPMARRSFDIADSLWHPGQNMFMMWVTHTSHTPFIAPKGYTSPASRGIADEVLRNYVNTIAYADKAIGAILGYLHSRPDADSIVTIIAGDHEGLAANRRRLAAACPMVSPDQFTPLIIAGGGAGGCDRRVIGQVDVYTTLLDILIPASHYPWRGLGISALSPAHPGAAASPFGVITGNATPDSISTHLREAFNISDRLLRHSMVP